MANVTARGIVIKQSDYGEGNRMLSIFTEDYGIIKAVSYGAKRLKSKNAASTQFLCYGDFELYAPGRDVSTVDSVNVIEGFYNIAKDIKKLSLCVYFSDVAFALLGNGNPDKRLLSIFLNALYALCYKDEDINKIKAVFELKMMSAGGYMPDVAECPCGASAIYGFDPPKGTVVCRSCKSRDTIPISEQVYKALVYIISCDDKKMLSFNANESLCKALGNISEKYVLIHTEQKFKSLDYYKLMSDM